MEARSSTNGSNEPSQNNSSYTGYLSSLLWGSSNPAQTSLELEIERLRNLARESKPRVITILQNNETVLQSNEKKKLNICVLGCQGDKNPVYAKQVAALVNKKAGEHPELKPDYFIILGDNFYPDGVPSPLDERFEKQFHEIFGNPELKNICDIPCFVVLGNHDLNLFSYETAVKKGMTFGYNNSIPYLSHYLQTNPVSGDEAGLQQIAHSMSTHKKGKNSVSDPETLTLPKHEFFQQESVNYNELPKHIMPHYFHSWIIDKLQIFILNSNTYVRDYLNYLRSIALTENIDLSMNQAAWTKEKYQEADAHKREKMFAMHHPVFSVGKRVYKIGWDASHYLLPLEITQMKHILELNPDAEDFKDSLAKIFETNYTSLDTNANYNDMLAKVMYKFQKMSPDMVCAAHDHFNSYCNFKNPDMKICQVIAGGGGSAKLQERYYFGEPENQGAFSKNHGFSFISHDRETGLFNINMFTSCNELNPLYFNKTMFVTNERHLCFSSENSTPLHFPNTDEADKDDKAVSKIRDIVMSECKKYQDFLHKSQTEHNGEFFKSHYIDPVSLHANGLFNTNYGYCNKDHKLSDVDIMHDMMNYLNQYIPPSYNDAIKHLHACMEKLSNKTVDPSLYANIDIKIQLEFGWKSVLMLYNEAFPESTANVLKQL